MQSIHWEIGIGYEKKISRLPLIACTNVGETLFKCLSSFRFLVCRARITGTWMNTRSIGCTLPPSRASTGIHRLYGRQIPVLAHALLQVFCTERAFRSTDPCSPDFFSSFYLCIRYDEIFGATKPIKVKWNYRISFFFLPSFRQLRPLQEMHLLPAVQSYPILRAFASLCKRRRSINTSPPRPSPTIAKPLNTQ